MDIAIWVTIAVVFGVLGLLLGRSGGRSAALEEGRRLGADEARAEADARLRALVQSVARGRAPEGMKPGSAEAELKAALERGWAPKEVEREVALREAIGRVSAFLTKSVRAPLTGVGEGADATELRERIGRALGALEDLDFFVAETEESREGTDLGQLAQRVSREFASDQDIGVRLRLGAPGIRASVNAAALMDSLYLVLHNAARFGGPSTIDLTVRSEDGRSSITVRDRGEGFSDEAFKRAFDPFYSTTPDGMGLGLPHARRTVEAMGGRIELRNVPDGGAEVEISFPAG